MRGVGPRLAVSRWRCQFDDPQQEAAYQRDQYPAIRQLLLIGISLVMLIEMVTMAWNFQHGISDAINPALLIMRGTVILLGWGVAGYLWVQREQPAALRLVEHYILLYMVQKVVNMWINPHLGTVGSANLIGSILFIYLLFPLSWRKQLLIALSFTVAVLAVWYPLIAEMPERLYLFTWVLTSHALGGYLSNRRHHQLRQLFHQQQTLERQLAESIQQRRHNTAVADLLTHELRGPLLSIQQLSTQLESDRAESPPAEISHTIEQTAGRAVHLIDSWMSDHPLRAQGRDRSTEVVRYCIELAVEAVAERYPGFRVELIPRALPELQINERVLLVALKNILENAATHGRSERPVKIQFRLHRKRVVIRLRDYGAGIPDQEQEQLFVRQQRGSGHSGLGVGLYLVRLLLVEMGGELYLQSREGCGTAMNIVLPRV